MDSIWEKIVEWGILYGPKLLATLAILFFGRIAVSIVTGTINRLLKKTDVDVTLRRFVVSLTKIALLVFVIIAAISSLGINTTSFVAILGAAGLAIGLSLQSSLANFAAGVMLIIFRPFKAGDYVEAGGQSGSVIAVNIFNSVLNTPDNKLVIIPNSNITGNNIVNYSAQETRRIDLVFGISYNDNIKLAKDTLVQILADDSRILKDPAPAVAVLALADSSINFAVRPWVKTADYWPVYFDLTEKVKITFDEKNISIPFPQTDVHIHQVAVS